MTAITHGIIVRRPTFRLRRVASLLMTAGLVAVGWLFLAPAAVGGPTSYVVTEGISMLPTFHAGGLVVTRKESSYHVGEVVAYHNPQLRTVVMHRIVAKDGERFVMKGDNNAWRDSYHPSASDIVGKEWLYRPGAGRYLDLLRSPTTFAVILAGLGLIAGTVAVPTRRRRRRGHHAR